MVYDFYCSWPPGGDQDVWPHSWRVVMLSIFVYVNSKKQKFKSSKVSCVSFPFLICLYSSTLLTFLPNPLFLNHILGLKLTTFLIYTYLVVYLITYFLFFSILSSFLSPPPPCPPTVSASQLFLPVAQKISAKSFYQCKTEESNSSQMSCQITTSGNEEVDLQSMMRGFEDVFSLDFGRPVLHSGMQVNMQARQNSSVSSCVREGHKINMTVGMGRLAWSDDSE